MPLKNWSTDRKILLATAIAVFVLSTVAVLAGAVRQADSAWPSSYASGRGGGKAAYLLLRELGYNAERSHASPTQLADVPLPATLILAEPILAASTEEKKALNDFVLRGGRILAIGPQAAWMVGDTHVQPGIPHLVWKVYPRVTASELTRKAPSISMGTQSYASKSDDGIVHYSADGEDVVASYRVGEGEIIWWAGATPLTNNGIQERDNLFLFLNSVGEPAGRRVIWDEYFHTGAATAFDSVISSPLKWAMAQSALLGVFVLLTFSRRHGPVFVRTENTRLSPLEFTDALAHLYRRARAANVSLEIASERFRHAAAHRLGLAAACSAAELAEAFEQRFGPVGAKDILTKAEASRYDSNVSEAETIELVRALHRYTMQLNAYNLNQGKN